MPGEGIHFDYGLLRKVCGLQPAGLWFLRPRKGSSGEKIVPGMIRGHGGVANHELPVAGTILGLVPSWLTRRSANAVSALSCFGALFWGPGGWHGSWGETVTDRQQ